MGMMKTEPFQVECCIYYLRDNNFLDRKGNNIYWHLMRETFPVLSHSLQSLLKPWIGFIILIFQIEKLRLRGIKKFA